MGKLIPIAVLLVALVSYLVFFGDKFDPGTLRNKRVLVTGASSGIGEQVAYYYSQHGARLVITARRENLLKNVAENCLKLGAEQVEIVAADMAIPEDRSRVIEVTKKHLGGLDHLILNHAILIRVWWLGTPEDFTLFQHIFQVNCVSFMDLATKSLEMLKESKGNIGVVSSGLGEIGAVKVTMYGTSKFALHGFFSSLRQELRANNTEVSVTIMVLGPVNSQSFLEIHHKDPNRVTSDMFATTEEAAKDIVKGVTNRQYHVRSHMVKYLLIIKDVCPAFGEDMFSDVLLDKPIGRYFGVPVLHVLHILSKIFNV